MAGLIWFRNNLRVLDSISLYKASSHTRVLAVYCIEPTAFSIGEFGFQRTGKYRAKFLLETLKQLRTNLKKLNIPFFVYFKNPEDVISELAIKFQVSTIYTQIEWTRDENLALKKVKATLPQNVTIVESCDQFLFHPEEIPFPSFKKIPEVFTFFKKKCEKYMEVRPLLSKPKPRNRENLVENVTQIPAMEELGFKDFKSDSRSAFPFKGGESNALRRLQNYLFTTEKLITYKKTRNELIGTEYSTKFSPWLANGSLSPRTIYWEVKKFENDVKENESTYWLIFELIWRDYFKYISLKHRNRIFYLSGINNRKYNWHMDEKTQQQWIQGKTPEPFVNANMIELAKTGWMSNRGRQNVASYWAKHLHQDWRVGAAYFESLLLDYDVHSNWGNWMYNSGVGNDPRNRKFNIKLQAERYDPNGKYQGLWLNLDNQ